MEMFYILLCQFSLGIFNNIINGSEMIGGLYNIINIYSPIYNTYSVCLKNIPSLIMNQSASFNMIRIIGKIYLYMMIDSTTDLPVFYSLNIIVKGEIFIISLRFGNSASAGTFQVLLTRYAPSIFPGAQ